MKKNTIIIVGAGLAGLTAAISFAEKGYIVKVLLKDNIQTNSSYRAQGGIAVSIGKDDSTEKHFKDTLKAGHFLNKRQIVKENVLAGSKAYGWLVEKGVVFDEVPALEAAHSQRRVQRCGDITGKEMLSALKRYQEEKHPDIEFIECLLIDLIKEKSDCVSGVIYFQDDTIYHLYSDAVVLATGGIGGIFYKSSNFQRQTGDGIAAAWRSDAKITDMEFIQFHPTVFCTDNKRFLLSEALRGEGGRIVDDNGNRVMEGFHSDLDLAPRDIVSRSMEIYMKKFHKETLYLDMTHLDKKVMLSRFPNIYKYCKEEGYLLEKDPIPVRPAAHYSIGGIKVDSYGRTSIKNLFACGECTSAGFHGSNRLASNSLLECVVQGIAVGKNKIDSSEKVRFNCDNIRKLSDRSKNSKEIIDDLRHLNQENMGVIRNKKGLKRILEFCERYREEKEISLVNRDNIELRNMLCLSRLIASCALYREESRGVHYREDFPQEDESFFGHIVVQGEDLSFEKLIKKR
ncbi:MAG: L-aspartate oxidase [Candidatus Muiribacterium halophilum]|uniref:L-aspartate oxidase n=1 Tax=Muiribacterium halophilum TaxID=2053465 RepID=A0A2N5ZFE8_MUIH1|nr:MAG: L-aspartate oxidase [Candidatus Muirbacterium halophilum]